MTKLDYLSSPECGLHLFTLSCLEIDSNFNFQVAGKLFDLNQWTRPWIMVDLRRNSLNKIKAHMIKTDIRSRNGPVAKLTN